MNRAESSATNPARRVHCLESGSMFAAEGAVGVTWIAHGKGRGWVVNETCGSAHAPAVLWSLESYRHGLKERRADESAPPTQKEITMKKLLA